MTEIVKKHTGKAPGPLKMMAAKGLAPIPPRELVHVVYMLTGDADAKIAEAAQKSFSAFPDRILSGVLGDRIAPAVLDKFAEALCNNAKWMESILLNRATDDSTLAKVARVTTSETVITLIANNQERILRHLEIVRALKSNPVCLKSTFDNVVDFLVRNGIVLEDIAEFAESVSRLGRTELEAAIEKVEVPFELLSPDLQEKARAEGKAPAWFTTQAAPEQPAGQEGDNDEEVTLEELERQAAEEAAKEGDEKKLTVLQTIAKMSVAQKIALAFKGNKEVRTNLIRDSNKLVAEAVIKSPRITVQEVVSAANSRSVQDVVIRYIASNREMVRSYGVKLALVNNPKTPLPVATRFLGVLRETDVRMVAKNKGVSGAIAQLALRMVKAKSEKKK
jgi:hypothetical protein